MREVYIDGVRYVEAENCTFTAAERAEFKKIAELLLCMCSWEDTKEGEDYWNAVYENLVQMAECGR